MNNEKSALRSNCDLCGGELSSETKLTLTGKVQSEKYECLTCGMKYSKTKLKEVIVNQPDWGVIHINFDGIDSGVVCSLFRILKDIWISLDNGVTQQVLASGQKFELDQNNKLELFAPKGSFFELENEVREKLELSEISHIISYVKVNHWGAIKVENGEVSVDGITIVPSEEKRGAYHD